MSSTKGLRVPRRVKYAAGAALLTGVTVNFLGSAAMALIESETQTQKDTRLDERMHNQWVDRKSRNVDTHVVEGVKEKKKAKTQEAIRKSLARNADPTTAASAAEKAVGSASKAAGSWGQ